MPVYTIATDAIVFGNKFAYINSTWVLWAGPWYAELLHRASASTLGREVTIQSSGMFPLVYALESDTGVLDRVTFIEQSVTWHLVTIGILEQLSRGFVCDNGQFLPTGLWGATRPQIPLEAPPPILPPNPEATGREPTIARKNGEPHVYTPGVSRG